MPRFRVPVARPEPDAGAFIDCLMGRSHPARPPLVEYIVDEIVMRPIVTELIGREWVVPKPGDRESQAGYWDNFIAFWHRMGYDHVRLEIALPFPQRQLIGRDPTPGIVHERAWADQHHGTITSAQDFEAYPWPSLEQMDFFPLEYVSTHLADGMGLVSCHAGGIYEHLSAIMSYEGLCIALYDDPDLVRAVCDRVGGLMEGYYRHLLQLSNLIAVFPGDDMGFRSGTLIAPEHLRGYTLPWHRRFARMAHDAGLPYFVHSCGNVEAVMEDLIADVRIDGKHSFEDAIMPIREVQAKYGDRIAVLGGVDVDVLTRQPPERVREYVRSVIDACAPRGRFAVGSGNSIPSYIPVENYLTMLDEALR